MMRWFVKRWVWAGVFGTTAAVGLALAQGGGTEAPPGPPKVGDVITLKFQNGPDQQVKVLKVEKQPDGSYHSEVKNTKTGETFTLVDRPSEPGPTPKVGNPQTVSPQPTPKTNPPTKSKDTNPPRAKPREADPLVPPLTKALPDTPKTTEPEREWKFGERLFGDRSKPSTTASPTPMPPTPPEPEKRRGLISRIFGKKETPPPTPSLPGSSVSGKPATPPARPTNPVMPSPAASAATPPAVRPTPNLQPSTASPLPLVPPGSTSTSEPPRGQPTPVTSPNPLPLPPAPATANPTRPVPPTALPTEPPVALPAIPTAPPALPTNPTPPPALPTTPPPALPSIPVPPGGVSTTPPPGMTHPVVPAGAPLPPAPAAVAPATATTPALPAALQELHPHLTQLQSGFAPSDRIRAAQVLAGGRHASSDFVKAALMQASRKDACPLVRAVCIDELAKLGYRDPQYLEFLTQACDDPSDDVRIAAKTALAKLGLRK
jgi:hypothetical protein